MLLSSVNACSAKDGEKIHYFCIMHKLSCIKPKVYIKNIIPLYGMFFFISIYAIKLLVFSHSMQTGILKRYRWWWWRNCIKESKDKCGEGTQLHLRGGHRTEKIRSSRSQEGGDTAHKNLIACSYLGGDTAPKNKGTIGGPPHIKVWSHVPTGVGTPHQISNISCW